MNKFTLYLRTAAVVLLAGGAAPSAFGEPIDHEKRGWLVKEMDMAYSLKPGMTVEQLTELFGREGGGGFARVNTEHEFRALARTYCLKSCPIIKIDVLFEEPARTYDPQPGSKISWISKPYLEPTRLD